MICNEVVAVYARVCAAIDKCNWPFSGGRSNAAKDRFGSTAVVAAVALPPLAALLFWVPWRRARMLAFAHPDLDPQGAGFHINQSLIAVGTGGLTGRGFMEGMQKLFYLPEASTDFIFANVAEELGFFGAMCIVVLFCVLGYRGKDRSEEHMSELQSPKQISYAVFCLGDWSSDVSSTTFSSRGNG